MHRRYKELLMKISKNIKNIIFDLGGVILNIDLDLCKNPFKQFGVNENDFDLFIKQQQGIFFKLEIGKITPDEFYDSIRKTLKISVNNEEIEAIWNTILLDFPKERIYLLEKLKTCYRTFLLSNTNEIHYKTYSKLLQKNFNYPDLSCLFEKCYYSFQLGMRKPNPDIFEFVLKDSNLIPSETLFIDDTQEHVKTARNLGIQTILIIDNFSILDLDFCF